LKELLSVCGDYFATPESRKMFEILLFEYRPPLLDGNRARYTTIFSEAVEECENRIRTYLPSLGYTSQIVYRGDVSDRLGNLTRSEFQGDRRSGLDYIICSRGLTPDGDVDKDLGYRFYDRKDLSTFREELLGRGVIGVNEELRGEYPLQLSDNYPFAKFDVHFDSLSEARIIQDREDQLFEEFSSLNKSFNFSVRVRDNDEVTSVVSRIKSVGHDFMIPDTLVIRHLFRFDADQYNRRSRYVVWQFKTSEEIREIVIQKKAEQIF
jgi:hypothetical protein